MVSYITVNGRSTADPQTKVVQTIKGEKEVLELSIASNNYVSRAVHVVYYNVTLWPGRAEKLKKDLKKGSGILVTGQYYQSNYKDKSGNEKTSNHINLHSIQLPVCSHSAEKIEQEDIMDDDDLLTTLPSNSKDTMDDEELPAPTSKKRKK